MKVSSDQKYDRQLRIWGKHGQASLEQARVCLLTAGPTGSEALKNLVLGGIASFTVVDREKVEARDLGNNFFVEYDALGKPRAQVVSELLQELNESVSARFVEEDPGAVIQERPEFFKEFNVVIATQLPEVLLIKLDDICRALKIKLIVARSYGLMGLVRISAPEHCVIESKPDHTVNDLRLHKPWPELESLAEVIDLDIDDPTVHSHIPFPVILLKCIAEWKKKRSSSSLPKTTQEKTSFKELVASHSLKQRAEENYREALTSKNLGQIWSPPSMGSEIKQLMEDPAVGVTATSSDFWVLLAALKGFVEKEGDGELPLEGTIPDMHSSTDFYVQLQQVYRRKAEADVEAVQQRVRSILTSLGRDAGSLPKSTIKLFCKNSRNLRVVRYTSLKEEYDGRKATAGLNQRLRTGEDVTPFCLYLLLRAADRFQQLDNPYQYPGTTGEDVPEVDVTRLRSTLQGFLGEEGSQSDSATLDSTLDKLVPEFCRFGAAELHTVAAVVGGIASQEAIKLITGQFVPLEGTLIYDAITSSTTVL